ncbi:MAG: PQQ-like beta-propeller repeat protein [Planctomycetaceae bacterium]|nr:PQQ-like beta-propeller repeat protein [Planctomycetaceae bacterium]
MKFLITWLIVLSVHAGVDTSLLADDWLSWRGPLSTGEAPDATPPKQWSEDENVAWKTRLPGLGHSSPVVVGDRVFVTTAIAFGPKLPPVPVVAEGAHDNLDVTQRHRFVVLALDRSTGKILWQTTVHEALPHEGGHNTASLASASPVSDGQRLYAYFGSFGLFALDFDGNILWERQPGKLQTKHAHGEGASPALADGVLVVNVDHEEQSFVEAFDVETGKTLWKAFRNEVTSWASPLVTKVDGRWQVIAAGTDRIRAYDLKTGKVLWLCGGLSANVVATPVAHDGILIAASSYDTRAMVAVDLKNASGDITGSKHVLWATTQRTPYVPSMLLVDGHVYFLRHYQNILSRRDIKTGAELAGPFRLPGVRNVYASLVAADGCIYVADLDGRTLVMTHGKNPTLVAMNVLDDRFAATPAPAGSQLFLRGHEYLYCIEERE